MKTQRIFLNIVFYLLFPTALLGQDTITDNSFSPNGNVYAKLFTNFHAGINKADDQMAFEMRRAYFGYKYYLNSEFSAEVKIDIGAAHDELMELGLGRYAYFKNAYLRYQKNALQLNFGLIDMQAFLMQEKVWGHRYIIRSFQDQHRFGPKADLGANIICKINKTFSFDITASNGEGYKNLQGDNTIKGGAGITINPVKSITLRAYYDISVKSRHQSTIAAFIAYKYRDKLSVGAEYNLQLNSKFIENQNLDGISVYSSYNINSKFQVFGRYDVLSSNTINGDVEEWNIDNDGSAVITGVQYQMIKQVRVALNYQGWFSSDAEQPDVSYIYLNFEVKLN